MSQFSEAFFAAVPDEVPFEVVTLPAGAVRVHAMTAGEKDAFDLAHAKAEGRDFRARLLIATVRDDQGRPCFRHSDLARLSAMALPAVEPMIAAAVRVNAMQDDAREALEKN